MADKGQQAGESADRLAYWQAQAQRCNTLAEGWKLVGDEDQALHAEQMGKVAKSFVKDYQAGSGQDGNKK